MGKVLLFERKPKEINVQDVMLKLLNTIMTNIMEIDEGTLETLEAIWQCCSNQGRDGIYYSDLVEYLPYEPIGDYPWCHLMDLESNMNLIWMGKSADREDDYVITVRGITFEGQD